MRDKRDLAETGFHDHSCSSPCYMPGIWPIKIPPARCWRTNSRTRTIKMIADTFTQRGVPGGELRSDLTRVELAEDGAAMCVPASRAPWKTDFFMEISFSLFSWSGESGVEKQ